MIPPGLVTKQRVLAAFYAGALALMLSGAFAPALRDMPWEPARTGIGILALAVAGMAAVFFGLRSGRRWVSVASVAAGVALVAGAAWLVMHFGYLP